MPPQPHQHSATQQQRGAGGFGCRPGQLHDPVGGKVSDIEIPGAVHGDAVRVAKLPTAIASEILHEGESDRASRDGERSEHGEEGGQEGASQLHQRCFPGRRFHAPRLARIGVRDNARKPTGEHHPPTAGTAPAQRAAHEPAGPLRRHAACSPAARLPTAARSAQRAGVPPSAVANFHPQHARRILPQKSGAGVGDGELSRKRHENRKCRYCPAE